jgi:hypothetical protein
VRCTRCLLLLACIQRRSACSYTSCCSFHNFDVIFHLTHNVKISYLAVQMSALRSQRTTVHTRSVWHVRCSLTLSRPWLHPHCDNNRQVYFARGEWVGVQLDKHVGKNNGTVNGVEYFVAPSDTGMFVRPQRVKRIRKAKDVQSSA